jgi:hypothetical protein
MLIMTLKSAPTPLTFNCQQEWRHQCLFDGSVAVHANTIAFVTDMAAQIRQNLSHSFSES